METVTVSIEQASRDHRRFVLLGDPDSGETTLLRYLTLPYLGTWRKAWPW